MRGWELAGAVLIIAIAVTHLAATQNLSINLDASGGLDAQFYGLEISASITGDVSVVGDVPCAAGSVWFSSEGRAYGVGFRSILSLISKGWILFSATGRTADEETILVRSLIYANRQSLIPLQAGDLFEGVHHTVIRIGGAVAVYWGEFAGTLVGGLAPAETSGTIRLTGSGSFHLTGERISDADPTDLFEAIPLDDPDLPDVFLQTIDDFFDLPEVSETGNNTFDA